MEGAAGWILALSLFISAWVNTKLAELSEWSSQACLKLQCSSLDRAVGYLGPPEAFLHPRPLAHPFPEMHVLKHRTAAISCLSVIQC